MAKKRTEIEEVQLQMDEETSESKGIPLKRALSVWRKRNPYKGQFLEDSEAVELFVKKYVPSLEATQEEFDELFKQY